MLMARASEGSTKFGMTAIALNNTLHTIEGLRHIPFVEFFLQNIFRRVAGIFYANVVYRGKASLSQVADEIAKKPH